MIGIANYGVLADGIRCSNNSTIVPNPTGGIAEDAKTGS